MVTDIVKDWDTIPFTEITVQDEKCDPEDYPVFERTWHGTEEGCVVESENYWNDKRHVELMSDFKYRNKDRRAVQSSDWSHGYSDSMCDFTGYNRHSTRGYSGPICISI